MAAPLRGKKRWAYLNRQNSIRLASINEDGTIYLSPLWFVIEDEKIYLPLDAGGRHATNMAAGRELAGLVDSSEIEFSAVAGVRILGTGSLVEDQELIDRLEQKVYDKYFYEGHPYSDGYFEFGKFADRRYFELVPSKMIGWDQREISIVGSPEKRLLPDSATDRRIS
ncbi:MAG: pyridoxamine 5'-phosphate oxidase family protein [Solirubrobacterales bacterium]